MTINYLNAIKAIFYMGENRSLLGEIFSFLKARKAWWLIPIITMLVIVGVLIIFAQSSAVSSSIYALF